VAGDFMGGRVISKGKRAFPGDLATVVAGRWNNIIEGEAAETQVGKKWLFETPRPLSVEELRRLVPVIDLNKSAILLAWQSNGWLISGLMDLGTSWFRARIGLGYQYEHPSCLFIQIDRPGRIRVYQGTYHVATLVDGKIERAQGLNIHVFLHLPTISGLEAISSQVVAPEIENTRDYNEFEFTALWNTYAAIANSINVGGHGGAIIIVPPGDTIPVKDMQLKYSSNSTVLRSAFIEFLNVRHKLGDLMARHDQGQHITPQEISHAELRLHHSHNALVEVTRLIAQLSGCDGATVISADLTLLGFGAEINTKLREDATVVEMINEMQRRYRPLDVEQFGMRHRSVLKLVSQQPTYSALVVSQDGPISAVWHHDDKVMLQKGVNLVSLMMPWA
jgi:hypothetical protein